MSPFRDRQARRRERERAQRRARREELSARLGRGAEDRGKPSPEEGAKAKPEAGPRPARKADAKAKAGRGNDAKAKAPRKAPAPRKAERTAARKSRTERERGEKRPRQRTRRKARQARRRAALSSAALGRRGAALVADTRRAWRRGMRSTRRRARQAGPALRRGRGRAWALLAPAIALIFAAAARFDRALRAALSRIASIVAGSVRWLDRLLTPVRGILLVTIASAACLVVSQFVDYRGVEIGQPGYADVSAIASAPQVDVEKTGEAHSYVMIPLAAFAVVMAAVAVAARRRRAGEAVALAGLLGVAVTLLVDLPKGLDVGLASSRFSGAHAVLSDGFYAQLAACFGLVICGLALSLNLRKIRISATKRARRSRRRRRRAPNRAEAPSLAESGT